MDMVGGVKEDAVSVCLTDESCAYDSKNVLHMFLEAFFLCMVNHFMLFWNRICFSLEVNF